ncbi:MAG: ABC transporter permease, partial [Pyrinomonadaceae bacterium]
LSRSPGFTTVALLSLALGIGANTAIFQLINSIRLKSLPVSSPNELAEVRIKDMVGARGNFTSTYNSVTNPIWEQIRDRQQAFSGILAWGNDDFILALGGEVRLAKGLWVSGDFFNVLGVQPLLGRTFTANDDTRGCGSPGLVISHAFWQREFAGDRNVIGRKLTLSDRPFEIIGVTPESFLGLEVGRSFDLAIPICADAIFSGEDSILDSGTTWWLMVTGRLKSGWTLEQANAHLQTISPDLFRASLPPKYPSASVNDYLNMKLEAVEGGAGYSVLRGDYERPLWLLLAIAALVLLIACANLANLFLARTSAREREIAVRQAVGASRLRLIRQLLAEGVLLAVVGAALGAFLAQTLSSFLVSFLSSTTNTVSLDLGIDWRVLAFTAAVAGLTCVLFGLTPALRATRIEPATVMKAGGRGLTSGRERFSLRRILVVVQVGLSLVLIAGAILFSRSLNKLVNVDSGFQPEGILITRVSFDRLDLPPERNLPFRNELLERIKAIPGVEAAAHTSLVPLSGDASGNGIWLDGADKAQKQSVALSWLGPGYFETLRAHFLAGRDFDKRDTRGAPLVAIVNESFARTFTGGANPVGKRFWIAERPTEPETQYEIIGLVKDSKYETLREDFVPIAFLASSQVARPSAGAQFLIRSRLPQTELATAVKRAFGEVNPAITLSLRWFETMIKEQLLRERLMATLSGFFGVLALLLASIGLYGILSYGVASRTKEIGIRMALGAQSHQVRGLILREALVLVVIGVVVGLPFVYATTRFTSSLLFGLGPTDPISLSLAAFTLLVVAFLASYLPARRATKVDPLVTLRYE